MSDAISPAALGYRLPAEWEPHAATWLSWPHKQESWPGNFSPIPAVWQKLATTLARFEPVRILASGAALGQARAMVGGVPNVMLHDVPTDDAWLRDSGPMFLVAPPGAPPALVDWGYNAWGGKYPPFELDDAIPARVAAITGRKCFSPGIVLEGGSIDGNGAGTILTTEQCLLNPNRNPGLSRSDVERYLTDYCNARKVLWLGEGFVGDDTDGHIDQLARFVGPTTVVAAYESNESDENYPPLADNLRRLSSMTDADGRPLEIVRLPMPSPKFYDGQRLPAGYLNFYIANGVVIFPTFDDPADTVVQAALARLFPTRQIIGQRAVELVWGLGAFHCITQQEPA